MKMSGAQAMAECLKEQGVETLFGYPGGTIMPFYDALYDSGLRHVTAAHEAGAIHSADGYARAGGKVGVCVATSGPGATNLTAGLATAYLDSVPLLAITGQVPVALIGRDAFQEVDIIGITLPVTKYSVQVKRPEKLVETLRLALKIAASGRPGPVVVDVPRDIQTALVDYEASIEQSLPERKLTLSQERLLQEAAELTAQAERPLILAGGGVIAAAAESDCRRLAEDFSLPLANTMMGCGILEARHPLALGLVGKSGSGAANLALQQADLIIALGCRFSEQTLVEKTLPANCRLIHFDIDPAELERRIPAQVAIAGDLALLLPEFAGRLRISPRVAWWRERQCCSVPQPGESPLRWPWVYAWLGEFLGDAKATIVALEAEYWHQNAFSHLRLGVRELLFPCGMGSKGFAVPAAAGAQFAQPQKKVIAVCGREGLLRSGNELYTIAAHGLPVITLLLAQEGEEDEALLGIAAAYGIKGSVVRDQMEFASVWQEAFSSTEARLIVAVGMGGERHE